MAYRRRRTYRRRTRRPVGRPSYRSRRSYRSSASGMAGKLLSLSMGRPSSITTGIPFTKRVKVKKEFILTLPTSSASNSYIYTIAAQNPNGGSVHWYNGSSAVRLGQDTSSCASIQQWFSFYEDCYVRACKVVGQIANNNANGAIVVDAGPTVGSTLGVGQTATPFDTSGVQPAELPGFRRTIIGGSNSQQTGGIKFYMPIRKLLGVKDMEDCFSVGSNTASVISTADPKVPNFESYQDPFGQTLAQASVFGNIVLTSMTGLSTPPPEDPIAPPHSIRLIITYYLTYRNRRVLTGGNAP